MVDGGYHDERVRIDAARERRLVRIGYTVLRLSADSIRSESRSAIAAIVEALGG